jgi:hypothetical protein
MVPKKIQVIQSIDDAHPKALQQTLHEDCPASVLQGNPCLYQG